MRATSFALCVAVLAGAGAARADDDAVAEEVATLAKEYQALGKEENPDLARRLEVIRRLGEIHHEDAGAALLEIATRESDPAPLLVAAYGLARVGDVHTIEKFCKAVQRREWSLLLAYLPLILGEAADPAAPAWLATVGLRNRDLRIAVIEALGRLGSDAGRAPLLELLDQEARRRKPDPRQEYELVLALGRIGGEGVRERLHAAARSPRPTARMAVAETLLLHFREQEDLEVMRALLADADPLVAGEAAASVGQRKEQALADALVQLLREGSARSRHTAHEALCAISGRDFGPSTEAWGAWCEGKPVAAEEPRPAGVTFCGIPVHADRVLFLVDVSASMGAPSPPTHVDVARRELTRTIRELPETTCFNLATFAGYVNTWNREGAVPASTENKAAAIAWMQGKLLPRGARNTHGALVDALERRHADTVFLVSDGLPSTGKYEAPEEVLIHLREANRLRRVTFHTIAPLWGWRKADAEEAVAFFRELAAWNGGTLQVLRKPY